MQHTFGVWIFTFHSSPPAGHPFPPAKADQEDFSQLPDKAAASGDWFAQSLPPACSWDRIHPQCAPTPPKSAAVRLHQTEKALEPYSRAFLLLYQLYSHVLRTILRENITADFNIFLRAVRFYGANWQRIGNEICHAYRLYSPCTTPTFSARSISRLCRYS